MKSTNTRIVGNGSVKTSARKVPKTPDAPAEFKITRLRECPVDDAEMTTPLAVELFWRKHIVSAPWFNADKECLVVFLLNTRRHVEGFELLTHGTKDTLLVNVSEVFRLASARNASAIIIAHNHPSGDPSPSEADIKVTRDILRAGALLKIDLLDHVVIGAQRHASLRALGYFYEHESAPGYFCAGSTAAREANTPRVVSAENGSAKAADLMLVRLLLAMEQPIQRTLALLHQFYKMIYTEPNESESWRDMASCGCGVLADDCGKALYADWSAALDSWKQQAGFDDLKLSGRQLELSVRRSVTLLKLLANGLAWDEDSEEFNKALAQHKLPNDSASGYLMLAGECIAALEASLQPALEAVKEMSQPALSQAA